MEATCIYYMSLHTSPTSRHPSLAIVHLIFNVVKLRYLGKEETAQPSSHF
jgi:hypothetical protein